MDRHMKPPRHVRCNMRGLFDEPEALQGALLGVVTELSYDGNDGALCVTGGIGDTGLHEELASRLGSKTGKFMRLPSEMASSEGTVRAWREAGCDGRIGIFVAQNDTLANPDALFSYRLTDRQLRMAGVALGILLRYPRKDLVELIGAGRELVIGQPQLNRAMRQLRHDIYS